MNRIYKKEYNSLLSSFTLRVFFGIMVAYSLFACKGASKEELEEVEKKATEEVKAAKEETEKLKKELEAKITVLEGRTSAAITGDDYTHIQAAVGLNADGTLNAAVVGSLAEHVDGLDQSVGGIDKSIKAVRRAIGMNIADDNIDLQHGFAKRINDMHLFIEGIKASVGLADNGVVNNASGVTHYLEALKPFIAGLRTSVGLNLDGSLDSNKGLAQDVAALKTDVTALKINVAAMPAKIVKGVNIVGAKFQTKVVLKPTDL